MGPLGSTIHNPKWTYKPAHTISTWKDNGARPLALASTFEERQTGGAQSPAPRRSMSASAGDGFGGSGRYNNPFITRFQQRRHDGGIFCGSVCSPPELDHHKSWPGFATSPSKGHWPSDYVAQKREPPLAPKL